MSFLRVRKDRPCPICGHIDWCLVAEDGSAAICPRTESDRLCGQAGWLHQLVDRPRQRLQPRPIIIPTSPTPNFRQFADGFCCAAKASGMLDVLATDLGVSAASLERLGVGWNADDHCWTFPLCDADRRVVGINRRFRDGLKLIMRGHRAGMYLPLDLPADLSGQTLLVCEGGTDTAAAMDLGYQAIGRFNCTASRPLVIEMIRRVRPQIVVIVADADLAGRQGAEGLARALRPRVTTCKVIEPPGHKDLRAWLRAGATHEDLSDLIDRAVEQRVAVELRI